MKFRSTILVIVSAILLASAASAGATVLRDRHGHSISFQLRHGVTSLPGFTSAGRSSASTTSRGVLLYHGGPVLHSSTPYLIYWVPSAHSLATSSQTLMNQYLTDAAAASGTHADVYSVLAQYTDSAGGATYAQTFGAAQQIADTDPYPSHAASACPLATGMTSCITDADLQSEVTHLITTDGLPTGTGAGAPIYFIVTPVDVNVCDGSTSCASNAFCAYHNDYILGGSPVLYSTIPFSIWAGSTTKACQDDGTTLYQSPNEDPFSRKLHGDQAWIVADDLSHEYSETITDPLINAWYTSGNGSEVGDLCEAYAATSDTKRDVSAHAYFPTIAGTAANGDLADQLINGHYYYNQTEWSNSANDCRATA